MEPELPSIIIHQNIVIRPGNAITSDSNNNNNNVIALVSEIVDNVIDAAIEQSESVRLYKAEKNKKSKIRKISIY